MRTGNDLRRLAANIDAFFRPDRERQRRARRERFNQQIKRDLDYGRDR